MASDTAKKQGARKTSEAGRPPRSELSSQQLRGITALLTQPTLTAAAAEVGVHPRTMSRWFDEEPFAKEYDEQMTELQLELWRRILQIRTEVWDRFLELIRSQNESVALRGTTWMLDKMLSVPEVARRSATNDHATGPVVSGRLRALLDAADGREASDESDVP